jgi:hypothetical protein
MKKMRVIVSGIAIMLIVVCLFGGCATNGGQSPSGAADQPSIKEWVDRQGSGANLPPWENQ